MARCSSKSGRHQCEARKGHRGFHYSGNPRGGSQIVWKNIARRRARRPKDTTSRTELAAAHVLFGMLELGSIYLGEHVTENLMLMAFGLPPKLPGETHAAWTARNKIAPQSTQTPEPK